MQAGPLREATLFVFRRQSASHYIERGLLDHHPIVDQVLSRRTAVNSKNPLPLEVSCKNTYAQVNVEVKLTPKLTQT